MIEPNAGTRLVERQILYASTNHGWDFGWTFFQLLAEAFARDNDVVYVDSPRSLARLSPQRWPDLAVAHVDATSALRVLRTAGLPARRTWPLRLATGKLVAGATARWAARAGFDPQVVWTYAPWERPLIERFPRARSVYWTGDHSGFVTGEHELLKKVDVIFAVSDPVYEELAGIFGDRVHQAQVACDFERYHAALAEARPAPESLQHLERPIFGYAGWVTPRVDVALLRELALRTAGTVVVAGPLAGVSEHDLRAAASNIVVLGPLTADETPDVIHAFDVALVPYLENDFNLNSNPVKFYEYLATGRPTVSTDIPTLRKFGYAGSVGPRATFVERALAELEQPTGTVQQRTTIARDHSFEALMRLVAPFVAPEEG